MHLSCLEIKADKIEMAVKKGKKKKRKDVDPIENPTHALDDNSNFMLNNIPSPAFSPCQTKKEN